MQSIRTSISRWRAARRAVLGALLVSGTLAGTVAVAYRVAGYDCPAAAHRAPQSYTYSGIGVVIERASMDSVVVRRVLPGAPADGVLMPGMRLTGVDGDTPASLGAWATTIRGEAGTPVELDVSYPCSGQETITLTRDIVRVHY